MPRSKKLIDILKEPKGKPFDPFSRDPALDKITAADAAKLRDPLDSLKAPDLTHLELNEIEKLKRDLVGTKMLLAQTQYSLADERRSRLLEKIDPEGKLAALEKERAAAMAKLDEAVRGVRDLHEEVEERLGINLKDYDLDEDGKLTLKRNGGTDGL